MAIILGVTLFCCVNILSGFYILHVQNRSRVEIRGQRSVFLFRWIPTSLIMLGVVVLQAPFFLNSPQDGLSVSQEFPTNPMIAGAMLLVLGVLANVTLFGLRRAPTAALGQLMICIGVTAPAFLLSQLIFFLG